MADVDIELLLGDSAASREAYKDAEPTQGMEARALLDGLQTWLNEHPSKSAEHPGKMTPNEHSDDVIAKQRRIAYSLMVRISNRSGEFPPSMILEGVKLQGEPKEPMAKGGFAQVFKGTYKGDSVAIKRVNLPAEFSASDLSHALIRIKKEALQWRQLRHENIVEMAGVFMDRGNGQEYPCMVSAWMDSGPLRTYIKTEKYIAMTHRLPMLRDIANGLKYCHDGKIFHGDLHWENVLINDIGRAMLTDFGTVIVGELTTAKLTTTQTPLGIGAWTAPEMLDVNPITARLRRKNGAVDVFAFGRMCLSISTKHSPFYPDVGQGELIKDMVEKGVSPRKPRDEECEGLPMSEELWSLAEDCWVEAQRRPTISSVLERL